MIIKCEKCGIIGCLFNKFNIFLNIFINSRSVISTSFLILSSSSPSSFSSSSSTSSLTSLHACFTNCQQVFKTSDYFTARPKIFEVTFCPFQQSKSRNLSQLVIFQLIWPGIFVYKTWLDKAALHIVEVRLANASEGPLGDGLKTDLIAL